jgi:glycosyltransferase involved in cell wall biosynthesis
MRLRTDVTGVGSIRNLGPYEDPTVISVILTTYERRELVESALASVFAQTTAACEAIVVDDGSTDGTAEFLRQQPVHLVSVPHSGNPAVARNAGLDRARGDSIAFLDSDDTLRPTALEDLSAALQADPAAGFAYGDYEPDPARSPLLPPTGDIFDRLLESDFLVTGAVLFRRSLLGAVGRLDPNCSPAEDWDYWLRLAAQTAAVHVARTVIDIGITPDSVSRAPGGSMYAANLLVTRKALNWCLQHRPASVALARRIHRRSMLASARYHWHRRAIAQTVRDLAMVARVG